MTYVYLASFPRSHVVDLVFGLYYDCPSWWHARVVEIQTCRLEGVAAKDRCDCIVEPIGKMDLLWRHLASCHYAIARCRRRRWCAKLQSRCEGREQVGVDSAGLSPCQRSGIGSREVWSVGEVECVSDMRLRGRDVLTSRDAISSLTGARPEPMRPRGAALGKLGYPTFPAQGRNSPEITARMVVERPRRGEWKCFVDISVPELERSRRRM